MPSRSYAPVSTESPRKISKPVSVEIMPARPVKRWEVLPGRNKYFCDGRIIMANNTGVFILTCSLILITMTLFFAFDGRLLAQRVSPAIPVAAAILFIFVMSTLLRTAFSDPGILPRATNDEAAYNEAYEEQQNQNGQRPPPRTREVFVKGQAIRLKYCFTCKIYRPPRASHCSLCDNCVERFDHHCPWVGNCVGKRNYRFFYMFIFSLSILCIYVFACTITNLVLLSKEKKDGEQSNFVDAIKKSPASIIEAIICFFSIWSIVGLAGFHTYLIASNQTTNEDIKGSYSNRRGVDNFNPFSEGNIFKNCCAILCGPFTPSLIRRRSYVEVSRHGSSNGALTENNIITNNRQPNVYGTVESIHIQTDVEKATPPAYRVSPMQTRTE